jgi:phage tail sheath gpL-like
MSSTFNVIVTVNDNAVGVISKLLPARKSPALLLNAIAAYFQQMVAGTVSCKAYLSTTVVQATGTITLSSFVEDDTVTVNGTLLTGKNSPSGSAQFAIGASDTLTAVALAACINANTTLNKQVVATSSGAVVTITALVPGAFGNLGTLAISAHGSVSGGGLLASGAQDVPTLISHGI